MNNGKHPSRARKCWREGCEAKYVAQFRLKLDFPKVKEDWEVRACKEHFKAFWEAQGFDLITRFFKENSDESATPTLAQ